MKVKDLSKLQYKVLQRMKFDKEYSCAEIDCNYSTMEYLEKFNFVEKVYEDENRTLKRICDRFKRVENRKIYK